jgi:hypothetical protein
MRKKELKTSVFIVQITKTKRCFKSKTYSNIVSEEDMLFTGSILTEELLKLANAHNSAKRNLSREKEKWKPQNKRN